MRFESIVFAAVAGLLSSLLILGRGILPIPEGLLMGCASVLGAIIGGVVAVMMPRRARWSKPLLAGALTLVAVMASFRILVDRSLLVAERYGSAVAALIAKQVTATGRWPATHGDVAGLSTIPGPPSPYLSYVELPNPKIAGFFVVYAPGPPPRLKVARRGFGAEFHWTTRTWR